MLNKVDDFLNRTTMYRLVLYYLLFLFCAALVLGGLGFLHYGSVTLLASAGLVLSLCIVTNAIFSKVFEAPVNMESTLITGLILTLIITPISSFSDLNGLSFLFWAPVLAIASKYIIAVDKKHIFNPAAFAVALTAATLGLSASWWVGSLPMLPFVLAGGLLVVKKMQRIGMVSSFLIMAILATMVFSLLQGTDVVSAIWKGVISSNLMFFAFVMLTEPLTTPPNKNARMIYGAIVGFMFSPQVSLLGFYFSPELALLCGNVFSYMESPKGKRTLRLKEKVRIAPDMYDFLFTPDKKIDFKPGQYVEVTLGHDNPDDRGIRRYFTIASSPSEEDIRFGIKFYPQSSSFKNVLMSLKSGDQITVGQLAGDFVMPNGKQQKLVFIAGGIGVTPYRSMVKHLLDKKECRAITLLYSNSLPSHIVYSDVFDKAREGMDTKIVNTLTKVDSVPSDWAGRKGAIDERMIREEVPDYAERVFYVSGPNSMVVAVNRVLRAMGVPKNQIVTDFFPGFA